MSGPGTNHGGRIVPGTPEPTGAEKAQNAILQHGLEQRRQMALRLGVTMDDLDRQGIANLSASVDALSHQVQASDEQRARVEAGLGLAPGSLHR